MWTHEGCNPLRRGFDCSLSMLRSACCTAGDIPQAAGCKPLVVVIENTEAADLSTLQDLILVLSEVITSLRLSSCMSHPRWHCQSQHTYNIMLHFMLVIAQISSWRHQHLPTHEEHFWKGLLPLKLSCIECNVPSTGQGAAPSHACAGNVYFGGGFAAHAACEGR